MGASTRTMPRLVAGRCLPTCHPNRASHPQTFSFGLFELDWETFLQNTMGHIQRCPAIEHTGIQSTVCGPESFTPDHKPLVGPQPGVRGLWQSCGFNSMGMMLSGAHL